MNDLLQVMQIIDKHSTVLPEGDYLDLCKHLKSAYNKRADPVYFFDYDDFRIPPVGSTEETYRYFYDYYFDKALNVDSDFIQGQITYLQKELADAQPIKRITKKIRQKVLMHYRHIHGFDEDDIDLPLTKVELLRMCRSYMDIENDFRFKYRTSIEKRLEWLEESDDRLDGV